MKKFSFALVFFTCVLATSCVSSKKYKALEASLAKKSEEVSDLNKKKQKCNEELSATKAKLKAVEDQLEFMKKNNAELINNVGNLTTLTKQGADNLEKSLESLKEKDSRITRLQDALTKKDSVMVALITTLKGSVGDVNDTDVEINVEKGVVFISLSDKMLFKSGSYIVTDNARAVLSKVAAVVNNKPEFEVMVESHTDNAPYKGGELIDNWDLSVKRSTSIVRVLVDEFKVGPERIIAAGRSQFVPIDTNTTAEGRGKNRRTKILVLPKLDQFYNMVEEGLKEASGK